MTAAFIRIINMSAAVSVFVRRNPTLAFWRRSFGRRELPRVIKRALSVSSVRLKPDKVTHTGQVWLSAKLQTRFCVFDCYCSGNFLQQWADDDYRNVRFTDRTKVVRLYR